MHEKAVSHVHFHTPLLHLSTEAGNAVYDVMTGLYNPAGRTAVTWYMGDSQLPPMTNYSMVNRTYRYMKATPLYKFGYGLSYTKFNYSNFIVSSKLLRLHIQRHTLTILYYVHAGTPEGHPAMSVSTDGGDSF